MNTDIIKKGFIAAGIMNIGGALFFSRGFTNEVMNQADPVVMSNFGLFMIILWGFAYLAVANNYKEVRWLIAVFAVEKLTYIIVWLFWMKDNIETLGTIYSQDFFAGLFFSIYGINDVVFMLFFIWAFMISNRVDPKTT